MGSNPVAIKVLFKKIWLVGRAVKSVVLLTYIGLWEQQKCLKSSPVISSVLRTLIIFFSTAWTNLNLFPTGIKANLSLIPASRVFLDSFSVAKECKMKSDNTNLSSYNPSCTWNLGTEEKSVDGIKTTSFTKFCRRA